MSITESHVARLREIVTRRLGLEIDDRNRDYAVDAVRHRMHARGLRDPGQYLDQLEANPSGNEELRHLMSALTVPETYFFRHTEHLQAFVEVAVPTRLRDRRDSRQLRILSAGCASGEEPYTLAIMLRDRFPELATWNVELLGIDINDDLLVRAREGRYSEWSLRATPQHVQSALFQRQGREFVLASEIRSLVRFEHRNLVEADDRFWWPDRFDIVFCRNVLFYFPPEVMSAVVERIAASTAPGGYLFLGPSETLRGISSGFHLCHTHETFYYQRRGNEPPARPEPGGLLRPLGERAREPAPPGMDETWVDSISRAVERVSQLTDRTTRGSRKSAPPSATSGRTPPGPHDLGQARELLGQDRFDEALGAIASLPQFAQDSPDALLLRAVLLVNVARIKEAEEACARVLEADELNAGAHYVMALCKEHRGDGAAAAELDRVAVYLDPTFAMPHLHLGLLARRRGDRAGAAVALAEAARLLEREDAARVLLFGGGFSRESLVRLCKAELKAIGVTA